MQSAPTQSTAQTQSAVPSPYISSGVIIGASGTTILLLIGIIGWFVQREVIGRDKDKDALGTFEKKIAGDMEHISDKFTSELRQMADRSTQALESLNKGISNLAIALTEQRLWMSEHYVSKPDFKDEIKVVHERVTRANIRLDQIEECPRGDCPIKSDPRKTWPGGPLPGVGHG